MEKSILYIDVENLQETAKLLIISAIKNWPVNFPAPGMIKFYVKADQTELWKIWANHHFPALDIQCKGVQHYTSYGSKNSADLALALDAMADVLLKRTRHIAVLSDDSDYVTLFTALKQEKRISENQDILFKWFMTDRIDTRSQLLTDFFPSEYKHVVRNSPEVAKAEITPKSEIIPVITEPAPANGAPPQQPLSADEEIALAIIRKLPIGTFRSINCKAIIKQQFPDHALNKTDSALFGTQFLKQIAPFLEKYGVNSEKSSRGPRKYELTEESKKLAG
ncbi:MAG TPA: NYN domain-containing protein [Dehalococcoidales bacterium]|nr:NYN domain-containing protein [Dehalococcoidales bacterium]